MLEDKVQIAEKAEKGRNIFAFGISQRAIYKSKVTAEN